MTTDDFAAGMRRAAELCDQLIEASPKSRGVGYWRVIKSMILAAISSSAPAPAPNDWQQDPAADERWNAGVDFAMSRLCEMLRVDPHEIIWDAATETLEGDVMSVIGNILSAGFGEDWPQNLVTAPAPWTPPPEAERPDFFACLGWALDEWLHIVWLRGQWLWAGTYDVAVTPTAFAPLPPAPDAKP